MAQEPTNKSPQQSDSKGQPTGRKIVVSSVVTHKSLLAAISERNPIISSRTKSDGDDS